MALQYGVIVRIDGDEIVKLWGVESDAINGYSINRFEVLPYLRPMSSMTDDERDEYKSLQGDEWFNGYKPEGYETIDSFEYLLENHFDFMGLIPTGAAIEVTDEINPYKG